MHLFSGTVDVMHKSSTSDPFFSKENLSRLRRAAAEMDAAFGTVHELHNSDDDFEEIPQNSPKPTNSTLDNPLPSC